MSVARPRQKPSPGTGFDLELGPADADADAESQQVLELNCFSFKVSDQQEVGEEESGAIWRKVAPPFRRHPLMEPELSQRYQELQRLGLSASLHISSLLETALALVFVSTAQRCSSV